jgi:hypothetical protein
MFKELETKMDSLFSLSYFTNVSKGSVISAYFRSNSQYGPQCALFSSIRTPQLVKMRSDLTLTYHYFKRVQLIRNLIWNKCNMQV